MYTRSYYDSDGAIHNLPSQGYDGTALQDTPPTEQTQASSVIKEESRRETKISPKNDLHAQDVEEVSAKPSGFRIGDYFKWLIKRDIFPFSLPRKLDFEDLLILGIAAYLLLSKSGDKECAILLGLLIFIK